MYSQQQLWKRYKNILVILLIQSFSIKFCILILQSKVIKQQHFCKKVKIIGVADETL